MYKENYCLEFRWTVSRGQDTYGYNICSLWVAGRRVSACNGGGYDMTGTSFGNWFAGKFNDELNKLKIPMSRRNGSDVREYYGLTFHDPDFNPGKALNGAGKTIEQAEKDGDSLGLERYQAFYSGSSNVPTQRHHVALIDGACGMSSVQRIAEALGFAFEYVPVRSKKLSIYQMTREVKQ